MAGQATMMTFFKKEREAKLDEQKVSAPRILEAPGRQGTPRTKSKASSTERAQREEESGAAGRASPVVKREVRSDSMSTPSSPCPSSVPGATSAKQEPSSANDASPGARKSPRMKGRVKIEDDGRNSKGAPDTEDAAGDEHDLSEYEKMRQANIKRNNALLESLDIPSNPIQVAAGERQASGKKTSKKRKPLLALADFQEPRRSGRRLALAEQKAEALVSLPDSWDEAEERAAASSKRKATMQEIEDMDWESLEPPPSMKEALDDIALAQAEAVKRFAVSEWKQFAIDRWGSLVGQAKVSDWQVYVTSRCSVLPGAQGSDMLQERFCDDVWKLLVSCLLMTRVSSADTKDKALAGFFDTYPTPSAFKVSDDQQVFEIIKGLGLFDTRIRGLREVTERFLSMPRFMLGMEKEIKPYGCGPFVYESYLIFCCGRGASIQASDRNLRAYCAWLRQKLGVAERTCLDAVEI